jgi:hypothetical protein
MNILNEILLSNVKSIVLTNHNIMRFISGAYFTVSRLFFIYIYLLFVIFVCCLFLLLLVSVPLLPPLLFHQYLSG